MNLPAKIELTKIGTKDYSNITTRNATDDSVDENFSYIMSEKDTRLSTIARPLVLPFCAVLLVILLLFAAYYEISNNKYSRPYAINTQGCRIHDLDPFNREFDLFDIDPRYAIKPCDNTFNRLLARNDTHIWIQRNDRNLYKNLACCYQYFYQPKAIQNIDSKNAMKRVKYKSCEDFNEYIEVTNEYVKVQCEYGWKQSYTEYFIFAPKKTFPRPNFIRNIPQDQPGYNVVVMGLDKISRMNLYRTMPKTVAYLKKMGAIELEGYSKAAEGDLSNGIPLLIGRNLSELHRICWLSRKAHFDNCPFIWLQFKKAGYYTAFVEDNELSMFDSEGRGFLQNPTDYFPYVFFTEAQSNVGNSISNRTVICLGSRTFYRIVLDYIERLSRTLRSSKFFGIFWERSVSYDNAMHPKIMDRKYERFLKNMYTSGYLNNTILIVLSDRGMPWGEIRATKQGRLEERRPFAYILVPRSFRNNYKSAFKNLKSNTKKLTTPYDIHAMMTDLADLQTIQNDEILRRTQTPYGDHKGISLFLPIPGNRTCETAGIGQISCPCEAGKELSVEEGKDAAEYLVDQINWLLLGYDKCATLSLVSILEAVELVGETWWNNTKVVSVVVTTSPGGGEFQSTLHRKEGKWSRKGGMVRTNVDTGQGYCIRVRYLKPFCYCLYDKLPPSYY